MQVPKDLGLAMQGRHDVLYRVWQMKGK
jgi:hypothetical protein